MSKNLRALQARKATVAADWRKLQDSAADRDFTPEEQAQASSFKASMEDINARIEAEQALIAAETDPLAKVTPHSRVENMEERVALDPKRGFASKGEFFRAVHSSARGMGNASDPRMKFLAAAPSTFSSELSGADGAFAVPPEFSKEIWRYSLGEESLIPMTQNTEINGAGMMFPKDETTPWGGSGVQSFWRAEGGALTGSKLALGESEMRLHELITLVPVTNELLADASAIGSYLPPVAGERIMWKSNEAILFGTGAGQPKGALAATNAAMIVQAKDSGQATATVTNSNISNMVSRLLAGQLMNAIWLGNPDILPALEGMSVGNYPIYLPNNNVSGSSYGMLKGRPLMMSEHAYGLGSQSDLSLLSLKGYRTITKAGGIETATSMHIYFDANATAFRFIFRLDGQPVISKPVTPPKSSNTRSFFVTLASRP